MFAKNPMSKKNGFAPPAEMAPSGQDLLSPFLRAKQEWDKRTGTVLKQKANWQRYAGVLTLAVLVLGISNAWLAGRVTVLPYIVEVAETGQIRTVGMLPRAWDGQHGAPLEFVVREWLRWTRTLSSDPVVLGQNLEQAHGFMTATGWTELAGHFQQLKAQQARGETVEIIFGNMIPLPGDPRAFELEWREETFTQQGTVLTNQPWKATMSIAIFPPTDASSLQQMRNPLGIFVREVHWGPRTGSQ
jgi:type IV secretion system protein TrbF